MKIALDLRFRVRSGASHYMDGLVPKLLEATRDEFEFIAVKYAQHDLDFWPDSLPCISAPPGNPLMELAWLNLKLPQLLLQHHVDIYHGLKLFGPWFCPIPMVHTAQSITRQRAGEFPLTLKQRLMFGVYGSGLYQRSDQVVGVSEYVGKFLTQDLRIPPSRVKVVYNGISDDFLQTAARISREDADTSTTTSQPLILCLGNIEPVKNHITALRAFIQIADQVPHHLVFAGRDNKPCAQELKQVVAEAGLQDRVHFLGFVEMQPLVHHLRRTDVLVHPSLSEGFGLALLEAMHCGVAVVASGIPGIKEAAGPVGCYIEEPTNVDGYARAILELLQNPEKRKRIGHQGIERAAQFTWKRAAQETLEAYRAIKPSRGRLAQSRGLVTHQQAR